MDDNGIKEKWIEICYLLSGSINTEISEKDFENQIMRAIEKLGWQEYKGEIQRQPKIQMGRKNSIRPDIIIQESKGRALIVIEAKRPKEDLAKDEPTGQLKSYMRQVKADFGLLIGQQIRMFYDGRLNPQQEPLLLDKITYNQNSNNGKRFVSMFNKIDFLNKKYVTFLEELINQFKAKRNVRELKSILLDNKTKDKIFQFLSDEYNEYGSDIVNDAFRNLKIELSFEQAEIKKEKVPYVSSIPKPRNKENLGIRDFIYDVINSYKKGIRFQELMGKVDYETKQVNNAIFLLKRKSRIKTIGKGIYISVENINQ